MKLDVSDGVSTHSELSNDSQNSQMTTSSEFMSSIGNGPTIITTSFIALDGLSSGIPTQTTPTLTPTTLRNIEQTFIELQSSEVEQRDQAGFVPPVVSGNSQQYISSSLISSEDTEVSNKSMWTNSDSSGASVITRPTPPVTPHDNIMSPVTTATASGGRRNGGRRPNKVSNCSPEEEQRRNMRRERNKIAAARCRKRRLDHTNALLEETEGLEEKKKALQSEIDELQAAREELQYVLERHRAVCRMQQNFNLNNSRPNSPPDIKPIVYHLIDSTESLNQIRVKEEEVPTTISAHQNLLETTVVVDENTLMFTQPDKSKMITNNNTTLNALNAIPHNTLQSKPNRPNSLNVPGTLPFKQQASNVEIIANLGVPITTPSAGIPFNFESLMEGGTGLTPVSGPLVPSCSSQQRNGQNMKMHQNTYTELKSKQQSMYSLEVPTTTSYSISLDQNYYM